MKFCIQCQFFLTRVRSLDYGLLAFPSVKSRTRRCTRIFCGFVKCPCNVVTLSVTSSFLTTTASTTIIRENIDSRIDSVPMPATAAGSTEEH